MRRKKRGRFRFSHSDEKWARWARSVLLSRSGGVCEACGCELNLRHGDPKQATIDHVVPKSAGGTDSINNLAVLCSECNQAKGNK